MEIDGENGSNALLLLFYIAPVVAIFLWQRLRARHKSKLNTKNIEENISAGLKLPTSLHPAIDMSLCIGCTSCVAACPEGNVLGIVNDKAHLVNPANCIGHGACAKACPVGGITLVFGTSERGIDIPIVDKYFETNVEGIYLAGEIGGMGLIRNAMTQGQQAIENIKNKTRERGLNYPYDVFIVGAGPAGIAATVGAKDCGFKYRTIEQDSFGGTVAHFPRGKLVMTQSVELPGIGKLKLGEIHKEELLDKWDDIKEKTDIKIEYQERLEKITPLDPGFHIVTNKGEYQSSNVLLAIGRRGTPRKLGVLGEELPKVVYRLVDPAQYVSQHVLVVGGGDSAIEAAMSIAKEKGTRVTLSYRGDAFSRAKAKNRERLQELVDGKKVDVLLNSNVVEITYNEVQLSHNDEMLTIKNDAIIINAGGILPTPLLRDIGINIETKYGTA